MNKPVAVIGDGWAALGSVVALASAGTEVRWIIGTGARMAPALPTAEAGRGMQVWSQLAARLGIDAGEIMTGSYLREFRNKAFREAIWTKAPTPETRAETRDEVLWAPERILAPVFEARFPATLAEVEEEIRKALTPERFPNLKRIEGLPVEAIKLDDSGNVQAVVMGSGEQIECSRVIYADRWSALTKIQGLPKPLAFLRKRNPMGILQATFNHLEPMALEVVEGFYGALHKESGEEFERHVWGYFSSDGKRSCWTLCLSPEEAEDNHEIAKKLRRMKNALNKMFIDGTWLPEGKAEFMANVGDELVRFEEAVVFAEGDLVTQPIELPKLHGMQFLTDGYGPSASMAQVGFAFSELLPAASEEADAQAKDVNAIGTPVA